MNKIPLPQPQWTEAVSTINTINSLAGMNPNIASYTLTSSAPSTSYSAAEVLNRAGGNR